MTGVTCGVLMKAKPTPSAAIESLLASFQQEVKSGEVAGADEG